MREGAFICSRLVGRRPLAFPRASPIDLTPFLCLAAYSPSRCLETHSGPTISFGRIQGMRGPLHSTTAANASSKPAAAEVAAS
jgi:hypothetical protein